MTKRTLNSWRAKHFLTVPSYIDDYPVVILRTFSKAYGLAGLRIGYGIGEESIISFLERTKQPFSVNMMAIIGAKAALTDQKYLKKVLDNNRKGKRFLYTSLKSLSIPFIPTEANYILMQIGPEAEAFRDGSLIRRSS